MDAAIEGVRVAGTPGGPTPVVVLSVAEEADRLPIYIGVDEAVSIVRGLDARGVGRPLTHDLLLDVMEELGGRVTGVEVTDVEDGTYIATLRLDTPRGEAAVDARPSDSLALAARTDVPIEVAPAVFEAGHEPAARLDGLTDIREVVDL
ncbi:MAG: bifunctional nuclease family protein [Halobacteriaceae archaeon]